MNKYQKALDIIKEQLQAITKTLHHNMVVFRSTSQIYDNLELLEELVSKYEKDDSKYQTLKDQYNELVSGIKDLAIKHRGI